MQIRIIGKTNGLLCLVSIGFLAGLFSPGVSAEAPSGDTRDSIATYQFVLEVDGQEIGFFTGVDGIGSQTEVIEFQDGNDPTLRKRPGRSNTLELTLSRGISTDQFLWDWRQQIVEGDISAARKNFSVILYDQTLAPVARWNFINGWPSKITFPVAAAAGSGALEQVTIVHERMQREF